jgi:transaldolase
VKDKPISFEVFADDYDAVREQAREISSWGKNVYVKIPITYTDGSFPIFAITHLTVLGVKLNITAITTTEQISKIVPLLYGTKGAFISVFAGRIADTGADPIPTVRYAIQAASTISNVEVIWASPREVLNIVQANEIGCHIITCTSDILRKLPLLGKDLKEYSLETVKLFYEDGKGFTI